MLEHDPGDVADRPLPRLVTRQGGAAGDQRAEGVARVQRAVAASADVRLPAPVDELETSGGGQQHLAGGRAGERGPHAREGIGVGVAVEAAVAHARVDYGVLSLDAPAATAPVLQRTA